MSNEPDAQSSRITPIYETDWPNQPITLTTERASLISTNSRTENKELVACGMIKVVMHWSPVRYCFEFEGTMLQEDSTDSESSALNFSDLGDVVRIEATTFDAIGCVTSYGLEEADGIIDQHEVVCGGNQKLLAVTFHLANYIEVSSSRFVWDREPGGFGAIRDYSEIELKAGGWRILLQPHPWTRELNWDAEKDLANVLNGIGKITRENGEEFTSESVREVIDSLEYFLSFVFVQKMPLMLCVGSNSTQNRSWQLWRTKSVQYVYGHHLKTWLPIGGGDLLSTAFARFYDKWNDPNWHEPIKLSIDWLLHADTQMEEGNLNGAIAFAQIPFEMLASAASVAGNSASEKIQQLLSQCQVSHATPSECENLHTLEQRTQFNSGPKLITRVRNTIIHPTEANRRKLSDWEKEYGVSAAAIPGETYRLFQHYLVLILLHSIEYTGIYRKHLGGKDFLSGLLGEPVPWANKEIE